MSKIAVVGAGPAGCSAGYHLARSGHHVTLIDREHVTCVKCSDSNQAIEISTTMS